MPITPQRGFFYLGFRWLSVPIRTSAILISPSANFFSDQWMFIFHQPKPIVPPTSPSSWDVRLHPSKSLPQSTHRRLSIQHKTSPTAIRFNILEKRKFALFLAFCFLSFPTLSKLRLLPLSRPPPRPSLVRPRTVPPTI